MRFVGKLARGFWAATRFLGWYGLGAWTTLAVFYTVPLPGWLVTLAAAAIAALFITARRRQGRTLAALLVAAAVIVYYLGFVTPDPNQDWAPEHSRMPIVRIDGNKVHVGNARNFTWHSPTDFTPGWYDRTYDLDKIETMYYVVVPLPMLRGVAHVFVCFGFSDGQAVAVSVEGRRVHGRPYQLLPSLFRQFQLIYVVGDERDVVGLRGGVWNKPVYFYPARTTAERKRAIFVDMMERAHALEERPEFYHLIFNNCMNNILYHLRRLGGRPLPHDLRVLLTGLSDRVAYDLGYIDTDLPFEQARVAFRIDEWMASAPLDEDFSRRLRETLTRQAAEQRAKLDQKDAGPRD